MTKICTECGNDKDIGEFWKKGKQGWRSKCKECSRKGHADYARSRRKNNPKLKARHNKYQRESVRYRYYTYRTNSKRRESRERLEFALTLEQFAELTEQKCYYCNCFSPGHEHCGVDRVDDAVGYVYENCVPCCSVCNFMKRNMSVREFLAHLEKVLVWCKGRTAKQENDNGPERNPGTAQEVAAAGQEVGEARGK